MKNKLLDLINSSIDSSYPLHSRAHRLNTRLQSDAFLFIKREDELSFGISGSKYRKYASLLPFLKKEGYKSATLVGSAHSNHLVSLCQLLIENQIRPYVFIKRPNDSSLQGNFLFLNLLVPKEDLFFIEKEDWNEKDAIGKAFSLKKEHCFFVKEGGEDFACSLGCMTLGFDIEKNQKELGLEFSHIFIDSGTAFTAIHLLLTLPLISSKAKVHIVEAAKDSSFHQKLALYKSHLDALLESSLNPCNFTIHSPLSSTSFGSTSPALFSFIQEFARKEGIFLDPLYNAKMILKAKEVIKTESLKGNILLIHSGGGLSLSGFTKNLVF